MLPSNKPKTALSLKTPQAPGRKPWHGNRKEVYHENEDERIRTLAQHLSRREGHRPRRGFRSPRRERPQPHPGRLSRRGDARGTQARTGRDQEDAGPNRLRERARAPLPGPPRQSHRGLSFGTVFAKRSVHENDETA